MENNTTSNEKKKPMTHEERLALAAKLDKELDDFIAGLEKKRYTEGWPEDRWQEVSFYLIKSLEFICSPFL